MTQQEFEDRTGKTVTSEEYARIEAMYMAAGNMDKDQFCTEYKKHGSSAIVAEYYRRITVLNGMLEERNNEWTTPVRTERASRNSSSARLLPMTIRISIVKRSGSSGEKQRHYTRSRAGFPFGRKM